MSSSSDKSSEVLHASTVTGDAKVSPSPGVDSKNPEDTPHSDAVTAPHSTEESGAGSSSDGSSHGDHGHPHVVICFTFVGIVIGLLTTHFISRKCHGVPLTVALFVEGILLGYVHTITDGGLGVLSESLDMWLNIDPHLLLFAFLPALLFGDSMGLSWHEFCRCLSQCCLLAGPGVVIGASSTAVFAMFVLPYGWDMHTALAFGSIMAATDPVAVVALLKDMGCDKTLTMQIAGESLLNDGVAIVLWTMFYQMMKGATYTLVDIIWFFIWLAGGGVMMGKLFGFFALYGINQASDKLQHHDHLVQLALTISCAYLAFFVGEHIFHMSGVLAVIFAALTLAKSAWPCFCSTEGVEHVWHAIEFIGNTLIFLLAGAIFGQLLIGSTFEDWYLLFATWIGMMLIRGIMLILLFPLLSNLGSGIRKQEAMVSWWGGLRGAVGLALALAMKKDPEVPEEVGDKILWLVAGAAGLTMLINATTCGKLIHYLQLTVAPSARRCLVAKLKFAMAKGTMNECTLMQTQPMFSEQWVDEKMLKEAVTALRLRESMLAGLLNTWSGTKGSELMQNVISAWQQFVKDKDKDLKEEASTGPEASMGMGAFGPAMSSTMDAFKGGAKEVQNGILNILGVKNKKDVNARDKSQVINDAWENNARESKANRTSVKMKDDPGSPGTRKSVADTRKSVRATRKSMAAAGPDAGGTRASQFAGRASVAARGSVYQHSNMDGNRKSLAGGILTKSDIRQLKKRDSAGAASGTLASVKKDRRSRKSANVQIVPDPEAEHSAPLAQEQPERDPGATQELLVEEIEQNWGLRKRATQTGTKDGNANAQQPGQEAVPSWAQGRGSVFAQRMLGAIDNNNPSAAAEQNGVRQSVASVGQNGATQGSSGNWGSKKSVFNAQGSFKEGTNSDPKSRKTKRAESMGPPSANFGGGEGNGSGSKELGKKNNSKGQSKMDEIRRGTLLQLHQNQGLNGAASGQSNAGSRMRQDMLGSNGVVEEDENEDEDGGPAEKHQTVESVQSNLSTPMEYDQQVFEAAASNLGAQVCPSTHNTLITFLDPTVPVTTNESKDAINEDELTVERELFLSMLRSEYWEQMQQGRLPDRSNAAQRLLASVDEAGDAVRLRLTDWSHVYLGMDEGQWVKNLSPLLRKVWLGLKKLFELPMRGMGFKMYVPVHAPGGIVFDAFLCVCFVDAHLATQEKLAESGVLGRLTKARLRVLMESLAEVDLAWQFLDLHVAPEDIMEVRTKQLALSLLTKQKEMILGWKKAGMISVTEAEEILEVVRHDINDLEAKPFEIEVDAEDYDDDVYMPTGPEGSGILSHKGGGNFMKASPPGAQVQGGGASMGMADLMPIAASTETDNEC